MNRIFCLLLIAFLPLSMFAQDGTSKKTAHHKKHVKQTKADLLLPPWADAQHYDATAHVYFPDYYTFYDPARGGYLYWNKGNYSFSPTVPPVMEQVNLGKSRIKILKGLSLDLHPELDYPHYMQMYPPDGNGNTLVPVPIPGNPAGN